MTTSLKNLINIICNQLGIGVPEVSYDTSKFLTDTMRALYVPEDNTIYIKQGDDPDTIFSIIHELRHKWQYVFYFKKYFKKYKTADKLSLVEYNMQPAELDAHAYAALMMEELYGLEILFSNFPEEVREVIFDRMDELEDEI